MYQGLIQTDETRCAGCNKCVAKCPVHANSAVRIGNSMKIHIDWERCIACGECIHVCDHGARFFIDDTERFFRDLHSGKKISVLAAPAIRHNILEYRRLFTWLRRQGVHLIYDVSFGADITTWAYLKAIESRHLSSVIAQPCPALVTYIQKYRPELLSHLAPVHSPVLCTAVYLHQYKQVTDPLAFLSPCIAKKLEFDDPDTEGHISYNVTYKNLLEYLKQAHVDLDSFMPSDFDDTPCGVGLTYSRPGGLRENVEFHMGGGMWIRQIEGPDELYPYLEQYLQRIKTGKPVPVLVDALNCTHGCNMGTAACGDPDLDEIDARMNQLKEEKAGREESKLLFQYFNRYLQWEDFIRRYTAEALPENGNLKQDLEKVFQTLGKMTPESRKINCYACGYGNCERFAQAVASGHNCVEACVYYARNRLRQSNGEFDELMDTVNDYLDSLGGSVEELKKGFYALNEISLTTRIIAFNASIEGARAGEQGKAFGVVGEEIRRLSDQSNDVIERLHHQEEGISERLGDVETALADMQEKMHTVLR